MSARTTSSLYSVPPRTCARKGRSIAVVRPGHKFCLEGISGCDRWGRLPDGNSLETPLTGIVHREDGEWRLVQAYLSIAVADEEALGQELPT